MKNMISAELFAPPANPETAGLPRFQIYRQTRTGAYIAELKTDSAAEAVEAFLNYSPVLEGGELRIWNHRDQRVSASVEWSTEKTDFGFPIFNRTNVFHDRLLGLIARQMRMREEIREEIQHSVRMGSPRGAGPRGVGSKKYLAAIWPKLYFSFDFVISIYTFLVVLYHS